MGSRECCSKKPSRSSWEKPQEERSRGKRSGRRFLRHAAAVNTSTGDLKEPASCFERLRTDTLTATSHHTHYALEVPGHLATSRVPERGQHLGLFLPVELRGRLGELPMFTVRQGKEQNIEEVLEPSHTVNPLFSTPRFHSWPHMPTFFPLRLFSLHITS